MNIAVKNKTEENPQINFIDLKKQQAHILGKLELAISKVLEHGKYILGPEVTELEASLAKFCGVKHAITCANGTDALLLVLMAKRVGPGDLVFVPSFTFAATAEVVKLAGATPFFVDSKPDTYNMDPENLKLAIKQAKSLNLNAKCIISVDLFGEPVEYDVINQIAAENNLWLLADGAQGYGAEYNGKKVNEYAYVSTTSFFPAKPLGCYGDGGCIFTNDDQLDAVLRSIRVHGQGHDKYDNIRIGLNSRLDTIQAAILIEKLKVFPAELKHRQLVAETYNKHLQGLVQIPVNPENTKSAWAQYTIVLPREVNRAELIESMQKMGVPIMIYYVKPLHQQSAYQGLPVTNNKLAICEDLATRVISLPMDGYISLDIVELICERLKSHL